MWCPQDPGNSGLSCANDWPWVISQRERGYWETLLVTLVMGRKNQIRPLMPGEDLHVNELITGEKRGYRIDDRIRKKSLRIKAKKELPQEKVELNTNKKNFCMSTKVRGTGYRTEKGREPQHLLSVKAAEMAHRNN